MFPRIMHYINRMKRKKVVSLNQNFNVHKKDFSIIASNCNGGVLAHDLGVEFKSPFVNLWITPHDYIKLLQNLRLYMENDLEFVTEPGISYPVGQLKDIKIYFQHYKSEEEAKNNWIKRRERIDYNNILVLFTDRDGCTYDDLLEFDKLPFKKVVFTCKDYPEIKSSFYIKGFEDDNQVGVLSDFMPKKIGVRYYDQFDFAKWIDN